MNRLKITFILISVLTLSGCTVESYNHGQKLDRENYQLLRYYELPTDSIELQILETVIVTKNDSKIYTGKVVEVCDPGDEEYDLVVKTKHDEIEIKYDEVKQIQVIEYQIHRRVIYTTSGLICDYQLYQWGQAIKMIRWLTTLL
jgi:hypothetical protein